MAGHGRLGLKVRLGSDKCADRSHMYGCALHYPFEIDSQTIRLGYFDAGSARPHFARAANTMTGPADLGGPFDDYYNPTLL
jgi:hypothetical protein